MPSIRMENLKSNQPKSAVYCSRRGFFPPLMANLLSDRKLAAALSGAAIIMVILQLFGLPGWQCPVDAALGRPCPGCGMTRALGQILNGHWQMGLQLYPMAPMAAVAIILMAAVAALPVTAGRKIINGIAYIESRSGCTVLIIIAAIGHWAGRLSELL